MYFFTVVSTKIALDLMESLFESRKTRHGKRRMKMKFWINIIEVLGNLTRDHRKLKLSPH